MRNSKDTSTLDILTGGLRIGYARTSKQDQNLDLQRDALIAAGCTRIYEEQISGAKTNRPELEQMLKALRPGDTVVVWQLSRFGRSLSHLLQLMAQLEAMQVRFESLKEHIDTSTAGGRLQLNLLATLAEYERELNRERTMAGLDAARARGRKGGRKPTLGAKEIRDIKILLADPLTTVSDVAARFKVSRTTIYKYLSKEAQHVVQ
ncbi:recombinase family protein [Pseudomonas putida]|uniref:Site-specific DNA recombinase n=1 Tax=Pseudomonas saponiphila TaxID=556534 RepID=A0A1H5AIU9_9PSED|nr:MULTISPECIES: recombinase family protein [Pseudomonas]ELI9047708.1 recombinase family protein [Pseudomonas aeruginosa]HDS0941238.1 recombinase family protein [Pseudomonas putida]MBA6106001.1 recombinase family protein [Pseudomonas monteilii]SED42303.1 Site-specific DNA recombinase [Pseudomonas saponiphila]HCF9255372.1 recombinase family protein [Pseudomonas aeruginosa]